MFTKTDFDHHFPFDIARNNQYEICKKIADGFETKKYVILQAPTGLGKSAIAYAVAGYLKQTRDFSSYVLTSQKSLQDQYIKSFKEFNDTQLSIGSVKGSSNYKCNITPKRSCKVGACKFNKSITCACDYALLKDHVYNSDMGILSYSYYMSMAEILKKGKIPADKLQFGWREFLVCDETHNIESVLLGLGSLKIKPIEIKGELKLHCPLVPKFEKDDKLFEWLSTEVRDWAESMLADLLLRLAAADKEDNDAMGILNKQIEFLESTIKSINHIEVLLEKESPIVINKDDYQVEFKPLTVDSDIQDVMLGKAEKVLMMSATILDVNQYCSDLNIDRSDVEYIQCDDFFPKENRPILDISKKIGKINYKTMDEVKPKILKVTENILKKHSNERGIIHTQTYAIAKYLFENLKCKKRLLIPTSSNREAEIDRFLQDNPDGVLLSPSLTEGLDLHGDLGRFSVIVKAPFGFLGDKFVKTRMDLNSRWYAIETIRKLLQSYGRTIRSEDDTSVTYILDPAVRHLLYTNHKIIPRWFFEAYREL